MKKKIFIIVFIIIILLIIGLLAFLLFTDYRDSQISLIQDNLIIEYGESYNPIIDNLIDIEKFSFIDKNKVEIISNITNEENKDYPAVGEYEISLLYKKINLIQKVEVKDTIVPELKVDERIEIPEGTDLENYDFSNYINVTDLSEVEKYNIDFSTINRKEPGEYDAKVSVKDMYGNLAERNIKIIIVKKEDNTSNVTENQIENQVKSVSKNNRKKANTNENNVNTKDNKTNTNNSQIQQSTLSETNPQSTSETSNLASTVVQPTQSNSTPSDLSYWCAEGGSHHVLGDGPQDHGYYSSWDAANQAFLNYTREWQSVQYKIDQCACGLYYFWAIQ